MAAVLVFMMQAGFALVETGFTRAIAAAMRYCDKAQFGWDWTSGDPQRLHNVNSLF